MSIFQAKTRPARPTYDEVQVAEAPKKKRSFRRTCLNRSCERTFETNEPNQHLCSTKCRRQMDDGYWASWGGSVSV